MSVFWRKLAWASPLVAVSAMLTASQFYMKDPGQLRDAACRTFECLASQKAIQELGGNLADITGYYTAQYKKVERKKGKTPSEWLELQLAYLAFRKALKFCEGGLYGELGARKTKDGVHDENSPLVGRKADAQQALARRMNENPALLKFGHAEYYGNPACPKVNTDVNTTGSVHSLLMPASLRGRADALAMEELQGYLAPHGLAVDEALSASAHNTGQAQLFTEDTQTDNWKVVASYNPQGSRATDSDGPAYQHYYLPAGLVGVHELEHVQRFYPGTLGSNKRTVSVQNEFLPSLGTILSADTAYKKITGKPLDEEVVFPIPVACEGTAPPCVNGVLDLWPKPTLRCDQTLPDCPTGQMSIGMVANKLRAFVAKYGSLDKAAMSDEFLEWVQKYYTNECNKPIPPR